MSSDKKTLFLDFPGKSRTEKVRRLNQFNRGILIKLGRPKLELPVRLIPYHTKYGVPPGPFFFSTGNPNRPLLF